MRTTEQGSFRKKPNYVIICTAFSHEDIFKTPPPVNYIFIRLKVHTTDIIFLNADDWSIYDEMITFLNKCSFHVKLFR